MNETWGGGGGISQKFGEKYEVFIFNEKPSM